MKLAQALATAGQDAIYSIAGRTETPNLPDLPHRIGGFGGVAGLTAFLRAQSITHVIDATHAFAAGMSRNAVEACTALALPLIALESAPWVAGPGDDWRFFSEIAAMAKALPQRETRIFLAIGRQHLGEFADHPQHHYLLRLVDADPAPTLPKCQIVLGKGPFTHDGDLALMRAHGTELVLAKNAGGEASRAKLTAARALGLPVWLAQRPQIPPRDRVESVAEVMGWLAHHPARRGV